MTDARPIPPVPPPARRHRQAAFSLVELLIAIGIIVLMLGLAMPAFRVITGGRSEQGAANQVSAMLNRARADAVGLQVPRGVAFYTDPTGQCRMAEVGAASFFHFTAPDPDVAPPFTVSGDYVDTVPYSKGAYVSRSTVTAAGATVTTAYYVCLKSILANTGTPADLPTKNTAWKDTIYWHVFLDDTGSATGPATIPTLPAAGYFASDYYFASAGLFYDQLPDTDPVPLPLGVGAQVITDSSIAAGGTRKTDGYLHDGVILFDANGRLVSQSSVISHYGLLGTAIALVDSTGKALNVAAYGNPPVPTGYAVPQPLSSSFGLVLFDRDAHDNQNFPAHDPTLDSTAPAYGTAGGSTLTPADEEQWLDVNATPLLINRYNGTLIRGE